MLGLEFEPEFIERLNQLELNGRPAPDLAAAVRTGQGLPAVFVVYRGYKLLPGISETEFSYESLWYLVLGIKDVSDQATGAKARAAAAPKVTQLLAGMLGWTPPSTHFPLKLAAAPAPSFSAGTLWLPIGFTATSTI